MMVVVVLLVVVVVVEVVVGMVVLEVVVVLELEVVVVVVGMVVLEVVVEVEVVEVEVVVGMVVVEVVVELKQLVVAPAPTSKDPPPPCPYRPREPREYYLLPSRARGPSAGLRPGGRVRVPTQEDSYTICDITALQGVQPALTPTPTP
ncbi:unnamed protein product [Gadus morhua 'NCC']